MTIGEKQVKSLGEDHEDKPREDDGNELGSESSDSDSEDEEAGEEGKRAREVEEDEAEALKRDLGEDIREGKRIRRTNISQEKGRESGSEKGEKLSDQSEHVWNALKTQTPSQAAKNSAQAEKEELVLVKSSYRFAGEEVKEEKLLPASHPEAIAYLASIKAPGTSDVVAKPSASTSFSSSTNRPLAPPRKKKSSLAAMSAAAAADKPTKINTLEKSKMDWNKFKDNGNDREKDEMEAQTKGGGSGLGSMKGYMERQGFLDRVQNRLQEHNKK
ncbi:hypothetical protein CBS101457_003197 [Exobasidium rhododendri]|nr:hypothetical protein CBS101457_003197 [Exobasidium rhododendri]